mmetsp:Transcript_22386/g.70122  ORF Transcript_22386/g.70122 Transcript_22386/m.70122 type:complete len:281 (-) Transcript_22386:52-894(-)
MIMALVGGLGCVWLVHTSVDFEELPPLCSSGAGKHLGLRATHPFGGLVPGHPGSDPQVRHGRQPARGTERQQAPKQGGPATGRERSAQGATAEIADMSAGQRRGGKDARSDQLEADARAGRRPRGHRHRERIGQAPRTPQPAGGRDSERGGQRTHRRSPENEWTCSRKPGKLAGQQGERKENKRRTDAARRGPGDHQAKPDTTGRTGWTRRRNQYRERNRHGSGRTQNTAQPSRETKRAQGAGPASATRRGAKTQDRMGTTTNKKNGSATGSGRATAVAS